MNPVCSYHDFLEFLQYSPDNNDKLIPVFLVKPSAMLYLNRDGFLDRFFDYFDRRCGESVHFFLPGYAHYPNLAFAEIFPMAQPYQSDAVALSTRRLGKIYYSDSSFVDFIEKLEESSPDFIYRGDSELLFIKYLAGHQHNNGKLDFSMIHRYNISKLFYNHCLNGISDYHRLDHISHFLEDVIFEIRSCGNNDSQLIRSIDARYNMLL